ncbi:PDZ domain of MCC-2 bdg protein for Usher syndrome [Popillia japonica]|uniref:PDZ domain of MCC-2 bdg protein for Usher syndrome n=1 Tax=Popillia japonica TaxID=7064 RepID=A0AAW1MHN9_POPJA
MLRLAGTDLPSTEGGGVTNCLTTYVFNPVDSCTGTPSPEKLLLKTPNYELKRFPPSSTTENDRTASETLVSPQSVAYDRKSLGHCNYMAEYDLNLKVCQFGEEHKKCCVGGHYGPELSTFGHLYTISGVNGKEERTYDEPYAGDLPRRSWLCCPGSQHHGEGDQPPLLANNNSTSNTGEAITKGPVHGLCPGGCEKLQEQLDEQAQRYEEQLTELHSVIAELTRKLHQQRSMAIAEEDEVSEGCTDIHDDSLTCPLEVSELEPAEQDLSDDIDTKIPLADSPSELPEPKLTSSNHENNELSPYSEIVEPLKQEIASLKAQLNDAHSKLALIAAQGVLQDTAILDETVKTLDSPDSHFDIESDNNTKPYKKDKFIDVKYSNIVPIHKSGSLKNGCGGTKITERIKLKRTLDGQRGAMTPTELVSSDLPATVAEHIMGDILRQCDLQNDKQAIDIEFRRLNSKLEHTRSQNSVLALTLSETKAHCDRLALLCGKYESNAVALRLALGVCDRAIEAYDVLLALLETELSLSESNPESLENRAAAETVAKQLLAHLDSFQNTDVLLSPWQNHMYNSPTSENDEPWTTEHENRLREHVSRLKADRSNIQGTYVTLESTQVENVPIRPSCSQEARKVDLELAVLMQELMSLREDKAELMSKLFVLEKEKSTIELKLKYVEGQQKAQSAALKNLQGQLKDTEALLALATQNKERGYSDAEHAQGVELELMQALAREARLKVRLQELVSTLEQVTKNAEARLLEGREIVHDLNHSNRYKPYSSA